MKLLISRMKRGDGRFCNYFKVFEPDWGARRVQQEWVGLEKWYNAGESTQGEIGSINLADDVDINEFIAAIGSAEVVSEPVSSAGMRSFGWISETLRRFEDTIEDLEGQPAMQSASVNTNGNAGGSGDKTRGLIEAIEDGDGLDAMADLLLHGADPNAADQEGMTPLMHAAHHSTDWRVLKALLEAGADLEARDETGATALMYAACNNLCDTAVPTLLAAGADILAEDKRGCTAVVYAVQNGLRSDTFSELMRAATNARAKGRTSWDAMAEAAAILSDTLSAHRKSIGSFPASEPDVGESRATEPPEET